MNTKDMERSQKARAWTAGALHEISSMGVWPEAAGALPPSGVALYDQLDMDFKPANIEIAVSLADVGVSSGHVAKLVQLLAVFRDNRGLLDEAIKLRDGQASKED
jgi:hypothetical protein